MSRFARSYGYLGIVAIGLVLLNFIARQNGYVLPDPPLEVVYLCGAGAVLNISQVRIDQGRLSLVGVANMAAALLLNPLDATLVGLASSASLVGRGPYPIVGNAVMSATFNCTS